MRRNATAVPTGMETVSKDVARARSLSENHLFETMICEFRMNGAADACRMVPNRTGQNYPLKIVIILNMAPTY